MSREEEERGERGGRDMNTAVYGEQEMLKSLRAEEEHVKGKVTPVPADSPLPCGDSPCNEIS